MYRDEWGLTAEPPAKTGRGGGTGTRNSSGGGGAMTEPRELKWYERALAAMAGAIATAMDTLFVEPIKQLTDIFGTGVAAFGVWTGWYDFDYQCKSGIGRASEEGQGTGDLLKGIGKNIIETPKRLWDAMEREDYWGFGAEAMNIYTLGRSAHGVARGTGSWMFNRGVNVMGRMGTTGFALHAVRNWQANRMSNKAMAVLGKGASRPQFRYDAHLKGNGNYGYMNAATGTVHIGEAAFAPGLNSLWPGVGGAHSFRLRVGNLLRGNLKLRTLTHEAHHYNQYLANPQGYIASGGPGVPGYKYLLDPFEFTQTGSSVTGAWNHLVDLEGTRTDAP